LKTFYLHNSKNEFTCEYDAQENPKSPGDYITPENSSPKKPIFTAGTWPVLTNNDWLNVADHRGTIYDTATGTPSDHADLGPLPSGFTSIQKPSALHSWGGADWVLDAVKVRGAKISQLSRDCESQIISGVDCAALGSVHKYPSTRNDQNFLSARFAKAQALGASGEPYSFKCQDAAGVWSRVDHTAAQIIAVGLAVDAHITESLNHLDNCLADLAAAGDDLAAIDVVVW